MSVNPTSNNFVNKLDAWLVQYATESYLVLPLQVCQEIVDYPKILAVPGINYYALGMMRWRNQWLPLIDLNSLITKSAITEPEKQQLHCLIVAFHNTAHEVNYVALSLPHLPYLVSVSNNNICALPNDNPMWKKIAASCFRHQNHRVPIVDSSKLFNHGEKM